jgi:predicted dehydrogenase
VDIRAVCDAAPARLAAGSRALGCAGHASLEDMLLRTDLEAVALFTGPVGRAGLIRKIIRSGRDVMTTKPFELDPVAGLDVLREARALGRTIYLNSPAPVLGRDIQQILAWQSQHQLGQLIFAQADSWYRSIEKSDGTWYDDPLRCPAAPIFRLGIYGINDLVALNDDLVELHISQARVLTGRPTPDVAQLSLRFASGAMASIRANLCCDPIRDNQVTEFIFERGTVRRDYSSRDHRNADDTMLFLDAVNERQEIFQEQARISNQFVNSAYRWDLFQSAIRGQPPPDALSPERIIAGVHVIAAMTKAIASGGVWRR